MTERDRNAKYWYHYTRNKRRDQAIDALSEVLTAVEGAADTGLFTVTIGRAPTAQELSALSRLGFAVTDNGSSFDVSWNNPQ